MRLQLLSTPNPLAILPAEEVASFLRVDNPSDMAEISRLIRAAFSKFEEYTGRQVATATYKMTLRSFPRCGRFIRIPKPPLVSVISVGYYATAGSLTTLAESTGYQVSYDEVFAYLESAPSSYWPATASGLANGVEITFSCGYGTARENVDEDLIHSLKVLCGHWHENRETGDLPEFIQNLWGSWLTEVHN